MFDLLSQMRDEQIAELRRTDADRNFVEVVATLSIMGVEAEVEKDGSVWLMRPEAAVGLMTVSWTGP